MEKLPDNRKGSNAPSYAIGDAVKSAPYEMSRYLHENWRRLLLTIAGEAPDG